MKTKRRHSSALHKERIVQRVNVGGMVHSIVLVGGLAMIMLGSSRRLTAHTAPQPQASKSATAPAGDVERGRMLFMKDGCYECHGTEAQGGGYTGPRLAPSVVPLAVLLSQVRHPGGEMPPFTSKVLSDSEIVDIYAFLKSVPDPPDVKTIPMLSSSKL
jgi:mono/diheme cytochrome c family protein